MRNYETMFRTGEDNDRPVPTPRRPNEPPLRKSLWPSNVSSCSSLHVSATNKREWVRVSETQPTKTQINTPPLRPGNHGFCLCFCMFSEFFTWHASERNPCGPHHSLLVDVPMPSGAFDAKTSNFLFYRFNKLSHGLFHIRIHHPVISQPLNISNQIDSCSRFSCSRFSCSWSSVPRSGCRCPKGKFLLSKMVRHQ